MSVISEQAPKAGTAFPRADIEACLRDELSRIAKEDAALTGRILPTEASALSHTSMQLDSLRVVSILCRLDELLGFEVKDRVVQHGGYASIDGALRHLLPGIQKEWERCQSSRGEKP